MGQGDAQMPPDSTKGTRMDDSASCVRSRDPRARTAIDASMSEAEWQAQVIECAERHGWWVYHNPDSRRSTPGYPDLCCVHPVRGVVIFAELKAEGGKLSYEQERWRDALVLSGQRWFCWKPRHWPTVQHIFGEDSA
jgi:hypothetical protein